MSNYGVPPKSFKDLTGKRFGRWTVLERADNRNGKVMWKCLCDCGTVRVVLGYNLISGHSKSCGCIPDENRHKKAIHNGCNDRLYHVWSTMKQRCFNPRNSNYKNYGARGISVCDKWVHDYAAFRKWAYENGYDESAQRFACTIDRIDNDGDYSPENCRWTTGNVKSASSIAMCCRGERISAYGYTWRLAEGEDA